MTKKSNQIFFSKAIFITIAITIASTFSLQAKPTTTNNNFTSFEYQGITYHFFDSSQSSKAIEFIAQEIKKNEYLFDDFTCKQGDIMIDIGAHVGMISILYAKLYPTLQVYAFEPIPDNYKALLKNIEINNVRNITAINKAVTKDGRKLNMIINFGDNTGGATHCLQNMKLPGHQNYTVESTTLNQIFNTHKIKACKILKIDCEGAEHEILLNTNLLDKIEYLMGEFHINSFLKKKGHSIEKLERHCLKNKIKTKIQKCNMADY